MQAVGWVTRAGLDAVSGQARAKVEKTAPGNAEKLAP